MEISLLKEITNQLSHQSTWKLLFLGLITFGIYWAHYVKRQTNILNSYLSEDDKIKSWLIILIMSFSYLTVILLIPYVMVEEGHQFEQFVDSFDSVWGFLLIVWGFKAKNRMNSFISNEEENQHHYSWVWTFFFSPLYFNIKTNKINEHYPKIEHEA